ncbi:MAG: hypothetical protein COU46_00890 [Candidatus Niyogibacteria bacterium CG10_big_fil_rev_8_21_14_0_10_42_19]|uniref:Methyltransferase domain-containing protein n=1 Tax=Candidatus Niyogibacteria bacterium CG10_big_fil_rev_8_21_14_0_10_42_19 TaxID=1974725 RepID=A0A2H0TG77_9BACT|nr:MAG: hypothetical protein COU46_00890 [Candidatus Niyogibacteria bacterium CG10_big_fil_rev_8_21_14_0_10_42_19]
MDFIKPEIVIEEAKLEEGMLVADFGCGPGFYTILAAKALGHTGKVYAFDIRKEMLEIVRSKAKASRLLNIETIHADLETLYGSQLKEDLLDRVIISNIIFQSDNKKGMIAESYRILKPRGMAVVIDWEPTSKLLLKIQKDRAIDKQKMKDLFESQGFTLAKEFYAGEHHYGMVFRKP